MTAKIIQFICHPVVSLAIGYALGLIMGGGIQ